jgi:short-subunit dehydrogenase
MQIDGSTILVTGASGGLGTAIARDLKRRGASLVLSARNVALLEALAAELDAEVVVADLADRDDVTRLATRAATCDVLVANAGVGDDPRFDALDDDAIDFAIDVNLRAPMVLANAFATAHIAAGTPGQIVLVGSLSGLAASPGTRLYNATKFGLRGFSLSFGQELEGTGVGCSLVAPGFIRDAGMFHEGGIDLPPGVRTKAPQDVADGVARAITNSPVEVYVAPVELRLASTLATVAPALSATIQKKLGVADRR